MSLLQIEGWESFTTPFTNAMLHTKLHVTNPAQALTLGGSGSSLPTGRQGGSSKAYRPPNQSGQPMVFRVYPNLRAASVFSDEVIVGFASKFTIRDGDWRVPVVRIVADDASEAMELCLYQANSTNVQRFEVHRGYASAGQLSIAPGSGSTVVAQTADNLWAVGDWVYCEFRFLLDDIAGVGEIRINGVVEATFTGDTNGGTGQSIAVEQIMFSPNTSALQFDDFYWLVKDSSGYNDYLGDVFVETVRPTVDGNSSDWTPSIGSDHYAMVDEDGMDSDTTYLSTATLEDTELFDKPDLSIITTNVILAVQASSVDRNEAVGTNDLTYVYRSDAPAEFEGVKQGLVQDTPYEGHYQIWEQDPESTTTWVRADIDAGEFGVRLK